MPDVVRNADDDQRERRLVGPRWRRDPETFATRLRTVADAAGLPEAIRTIDGEALDGASG